MSGLSQRTVVYVDGRRVNPVRGKLRLPIGTYQLQVEEVHGEQVMAIVERVTVEADASENVRLQLRLVYSGYVRLPGRPGPRGAVGPPGPAGSVAPEDAYATANVEHTLYNELRYSLEDLQGRVDRLRNRHPPASAPDYYCADGCEVLPGPPGPPGPVGPPGAPPAFPDIHVVQDAQGQPIISEVRKLLDLPRLNDVFTVLEQRAVTAPPPALPVRSASIELLTDEAQASIRAQRRRNEEHKRALATGEAALGDAPGPVGAPGPRGPRGPVTSSPPPFVPPVQLSPEQSKKLLNRVRSDKYLAEILNEIIRDIGKIAFVLKQYSQE